MTWNYRIVRRETKHGPLWELHEIYYDENDTPKMRSAKPVRFSSDESPEDLIASLACALDDARRRGVLQDFVPEERRDGAGD